MRAKAETTPIHPCFDGEGRKNVGRIHLPVAPRASRRPRFGAPAAARQAMLPMDALALLEDVMRQGTGIGMVGITGPGDPLALPEPTLETLRLVRDRFPEIGLCLTATGLGGADVAEALAELGLSHVTILMDTVDPKEAEALYAWIRPGVKTLPLAEAAPLLIREQAEAITAFKAAGLAAKVNAVVYPGLNDAGLEAAAKTAAGLGADVMALSPYAPNEEDRGDPEAPPIPDDGLMRSLRGKAARHIRLVSAFDSCGAAIVGTVCPENEAPGGDPRLAGLKPTDERPNVAVCSEEGMEVDQHLGRASRFLVFGPKQGPDGGAVSLIEARTAPAPGSGASRWEAAADVLSDCFALLAESAGDSPRTILGRSGIRVLTAEGGLEDAVDILYGGGKKGNKCRGRRPL